MKHRITYSAPARRAYHGKRARRQSFYKRQRTVRLLDRISGLAGLRRVVEDAWLDALVHGSAWYQMTPEGMVRTIPIEGTWLP